MKIRYISPNINLSLIFRLILITIFYLVCGASRASITNTPAPVECAKSDGWTQNADGCWWNQTGQVSGKNHISAKTKFKGYASGTLVNGFNNYVPYSGQWLIRSYICPTTKSIACTIAKAGSFVDSVTPVELSSKVSIADTRGNWGGASGDIPADSSICYAFIDTRAPTIAWGTAAERTCQDAQKLPDTPADCYVNGGGSLDVDLGTLERGEVATVIDKNSAMAKSKTVSVLCTRDAATTVSAKFKYTPISVNGNNVLKGEDGLGVAIYYNDSLVQADQELPVETFEPGYTNVELTFVPVRDANIDVSKIATGKFSANAVLELTEQ